MHLDFEVSVAMNHSTKESGDVTELKFLECRINICHNIRSISIDLNHIANYTVIDPVRI